MKKFLSFLWKVLAVILAAGLLIWGGLITLKEKAEAGGGSDSLALVHQDDWVDLGLPSGLLWGKTNIGGTSQGETNYLYAWGDTLYRERGFAWITYHFTVDDQKSNIPSPYASLPTHYGKLIKYCTNPASGKDGFVDHLTKLEWVDDAATISWGKGARIPTPEEWLELKDNTTHKWMTIDGVAGMLFTGPNGNSIFLPAAGYSADGFLDGFGTYGSYWTNSLSNIDIKLTNSSDDVYATLDTSYGAKCFDFSSINYLGVRIVPRYHGLSIRAVHSAK